MTNYLKLADEAAAALKPVLLGSDSMIAQPGLIQRLEAAVRELVLAQGRAWAEAECDRVTAQLNTACDERDEARAELEQTTLAWQGQQMAVVHWMKKCELAEENFDSQYKNLEDSYYIIIKERDEAIVERDSWKKWSEGQSRAREREAANAVEITRNLQDQIEKLKAELKNWQDSV